MKGIEAATTGVEPADGSPPAQETPPEHSEDLIFAALSDVTRRRILDDLYDRDGQRLVELSLKFDMSRQAVLKHLNLLERAGLITAERRRRKTVYYLNRAPLQRIHLQWLAKFTNSTSTSTAREPRCAAKGDIDGVS